MKTRILTLAALAALLFINFSLLCCTADGTKLSPTGAIIVTTDENAGIAAAEAAVAGKLAGESNAQIKADVLKAAKESVLPSTPAHAVPATP